MLEECNFPLVQSYISLREILDHFNHIKQETLFPVDLKLPTPSHLVQSECSLNGINYMILTDTNYERDCIADYFTEPIRILSHHDSKPTALDYWIKHKDHLVLDIDNQSLRDYLYRRTKEPIDFRPSLIACVLKYLGSRKVLDLSILWGSRLAASMAADVEMYYGIEPNYLLYSLGHTIRRTYSECSDTKVALFHDNWLSHGCSHKFDTILASPPYYNLHIYDCKNSKQTHNKKTPDIWFNEYLVPYLHKAWESLQNDGVLIILIYEDRLHPFYRKMIRYMNRYEDSVFLGMLSYTRVDNQQTFQPVWIWKKVPIIYNGAKPVEDNLVKHADDITNDYIISAKGKNLVVLSRIPMPTFTRYGALVLTPNDIYPRFTTTIQKNVTVIKHQMYTGLMQTVFIRYILDHFQVNTFYLKDSNISYTKVCFAYACYLLGKKAIVCINTKDKWSNNINKAKSLGAVVTSNYKNNGKLISFQDLMKYCKPIRLPSIPKHSTLWCLDNSEYITNVCPDINIKILPTNEYNQADLLRLVQSEEKYSKDYVLQSFNY